MGSELPEPLSLSTVSAEPEKFAKALKVEVRELLTFERVERRTSGQTSPYRHPMCCEISENCSTTGSELDKAAGAGMQKTNDAETINSKQI